MHMTNITNKVTYYKDIKEVIKWMAMPILLQRCSSKRLTKLVVISVLNSEMYREI